MKESSAKTLCKDLQRVSLIYAQVNAIRPAKDLVDIPFTKAVGFELVTVHIPASKPGVTIYFVIVAGHLEVQGFELHRGGGDCHKNPKERKIKGRFFFGSHGVGRNWRTKIIFF
jgi:hypothetical protein